VATTTPLVTTPASAAPVRLAHRVPVLWELHKVHHSATVLTPFTV
jgi:hypothetical protein